MSVRRSSLSGMPQCSIIETNPSRIHDDVIKWKHFLRYWPFVRVIHLSPVNSPHKSQWCGALMFSLMYTWANGWVNNRDAGDLRRYGVHCDVSVMWYFVTCFITVTLHERHDVSKRQQRDCLINVLFRLITNRIHKRFISDPLWGESTGDQWIPLTKG